MAIKTMWSNYAEKFVAITPSDDAVVPSYGSLKGLLIGTGGTMVVVDKAGIETTLVVPAGYNPIRPYKIKSTGLVSVANIVGLI